MVECIYIFFIYKTGSDQSQECDTLENIVGNEVNYVDTSRVLY